MSNTATANPTKVVTGKARLSYAWLLQPREGQEGAAPKYQCDIIIPKSDKATIAAIKKAYQAAINKGLADSKLKWTPNTPKTPEFWNPLRDGDLREDADPAYANAYYLCAKANVDRRPKVVGTDLQPVLDADQVYSGMYARVSFDLYPFNNKTKGIACGLLNVQVLGGGERLGGVSSNPEDDFGEPLADGADDLLG